MPPVVPKVIRVANLEAVILVQENEVAQPDLSGFKGLMIGQAVLVEFRHARTNRSRDSADHGAQIETIYHLRHEARQMLFRQPIVHRWGKQKPRPSIKVTEVVHRKLTVWRSESHARS